MKFSLEEIVRRIGGKIEGDPSQMISGPGQIENGQEGTITFFANPKYEVHLYTTNCSAILVPSDFVALKPIAATLIKVENVYEAFGVVLLMFAKSPTMPSDISNLAFIASSAHVGKEVGIDHFAYIGEQASIGTGTKIGAQVFIGEGCKIGANCMIYPGVKLYHSTEVGDHVIIHSNSVIGSDGFGFSQARDLSFQKIPQTGKVVIEDHVEIGACTTIDRATIGITRICHGAKLDNLIQVAHNVEIGQNTAIAAQTGISGSTKIGKNCMIGGQVGFVGHIQVADGSMIQAKTGVSSNLNEPNKKYYGYPAMGYQDYLKSYAYFRKFPDIVDKIRSLEKEIDQLKRTFDHDI